MEKAATAKPNEKGEQREIYSLHNTTTTLAEGIQLLQARAQVLAKHIYTAYNQWKAKCLCEKNLAYGTFVHVIDYQQNLTVELSSTPTSTVCGANQVNVMVFPCVVYWRDT